MTEYTLPPAPPTAPAATTKRSRRPVILAAAVTGVLGLLIGAGLGYGGTPDPIIETKTVEKEVRVSVPAEVPSSCLSTYRLAEEAFLTYEQLGPLASESIEAAVTHDVPGMNALSPRIGAAKDEIGTALQSYLISKGICEDALGMTLPAVTAADL